MNVLLYVERGRTLPRCDFLVICSHPSSSLLPQLQGSGHEIHTPDRLEIEKQQVTFDDPEGVRVRWLLVEIPIQNALRVAQQDDYMKRVRGNGGARTALKPEGIVILGQYGPHVAIATALGIPTPSSGDSISVRVMRARSRAPGVAEIAGELWQVAGPNDPVISAPDLPSIKATMIS